MTNIKNVVEQFDKIIKEESKKRFNNKKDFIKNEEQSIRDDLKEVKDQLRDRLEIIKAIEGNKTIRLDPITSKALEIVLNDDVELMDVTDMDTYSEFRTKSFALITEGEMLLEGPKGLDKKVIGLLSDMIFTLYKYEKVSKEDINKTMCYKFTDERTFLSLDEKNNGVKFKTISKIFKEEKIHTQIKDNAFVPTAIESMINLIDSATK